MNVIEWLLQDDKYIYFGTWGSGSYRVDYNNHQFNNQ